MSLRRTQTTHRRTNVPLLVAVVAAVIGVGLLVLMLTDARRLVGIGFSGHIWYVLLLFLGIATAVTTFSVLKSYARYTGHLLHGTVELGGPFVAALIVTILGFYLVPSPAQKFDVTIFVHGEAGRQSLVLRNRGQVRLDLGSDKREETVGSKGEARIPGIPADLRDRKVPVTITDDVYELADPELELRLSQDVFYVAVRPKLLRFDGLVLDGQARPLAQARVRVGDNIAVTDEDGRFKLMLPATLPDEDRIVVISAHGYEPWRGRAIPGGNLFQVRLLPALNGG